jgi:hypothetical protein
LNERISSEYECLSKNSEKALGSKEESGPVIGSGATSHCSSEIEHYGSPDKRYTGGLSTASKSTRITGKGVMKIPLSSGRFMRLNNVLYVPGMAKTLLSTQSYLQMGLAILILLEKGINSFEKMERP